MNTLQNPTILSVSIEAGLADAIDHHHSPMDGAIALAQIEAELPDLHRQVRPRRWDAWLPGYARLYRAGLSWSGLGFTYVQIGDVLHVLDVWQTGDQRLDVVFPMPDDSYGGEIVEHKGGVSLITF